MSSQQEENQQSCLYIVATPIGNMADCSARAQKALQDADIIAAEDTRHSQLLLNRLGISGKKLVSYHDHNEAQRSLELIQRMQAEPLRLALISDAGTPCISDPGYRLVAKAKQAGLKVVPIPGPSAITALVSAAGLPCERFIFIGFLPTRKAALITEVSRWSQYQASVVCYESAKRLPTSLPIIAQFHSQARIAIGRELSKVHEELVTLPIQEALLWCQSHPCLKGELALMIDPGKEELDRVALAEQVAQQARVLIKENPNLSHKDLMQEFEDAGLGKKELYRCLLAVLDEKL